MTTRHTVMLTLTCGKTMLLTVLRRRWNREMTTARIDLEQMIADQLASRAEDEPHNRDAVEADMAAEIGDAVRQLREQVGLNQTQVAALMNSSQPTVNRIETGQVLATPPAWFASCGPWALHTFTWNLPRGHQHRCKEIATARSRPTTYALSAAWQSIIAWVSSALWTARRLGWLSTISRSVFLRQNTSMLGAE
jgi:DNA-binding transcriptional regulator YiaG